MQCHSIVHPPIVTNMQKYFSGQYVCLIFIIILVSNIFKLFLTHTHTHKHNLDTPWQTIKRKRIYSCKNTSCTKENNTKLYCMF